MQNLLSRTKMTVVQPSGHINAANATNFQQHLIEAVESGHHSALLVDMSQVESLDSAGLMALVSALTTAQQLEKRFSICSVPPSIRIIFEVTQLDRVFNIFETRSAGEMALA
ncbi:MAG TPA: STAS domain-containing protein [Allocoleopsis sp.]